MTKYTYLTAEERTLISHYHDNEISIGEIARRINRSKSTISRELKRNANTCGYLPQTAHNRYLSRRHKSSKIDKSPPLKAYIIDRLYEGFSPEIIALRLKNTASLEGVTPISHEAIYQWLYKPPQKAEKLYKLLVRHHAKRRRRLRVHRSQIHGRVSIHERPKAIENRCEIGHWEGDLIAFRGNTQHALVLHERKSRYTVTIKLGSKRADETMEKILQFFKTLPRNLLKSVTFDNGMEFAHHHVLGQKLKVATYFCDVYASWQKGGIENMNGRLRRDLPRKTDISAMSEEDLEEIVLGHNMMPRKVLGGLSAIETLAKHFGKNILFLFNHGVAARY